MPMDISSSPWQKLGVELFFQFGKWHILIADYYSEFPIVHMSPSIPSKDVISALSSSILVLGIPDELISDNASLWQKNILTLQPPKDSSF